MILQWSDMIMAKKFGTGLDLIFQSIYIFQQSLIKLMFNNKRLPAWFVWFDPFFLITFSKVIN